MWSKIGEEFLDLASKTIHQRNNWTLSKLKIGFVKHRNKKDKLQTGGKTFANYTSGKGLVLRIYKVFSALNIKKQTENLKTTWADISGRYTDDKHLKSAQHHWALEMQIKIMRYH